MLIDQVIEEGVPVANRGTFTCRAHQKAFHKAWVQGRAKRLIAIWHRRAGKDEVALNATRDMMLERPANYWHCLPEYEQGRKAIWNAINAHTGKRRIHEAFPDHLVAGMDATQMLVRFNNGATWQVVGSDKYDATVGSGVAGIVYSEWALANPNAWAYHRPMVEENNGWAAFITTPRGNNHAKRMYDSALTNPKWFAQLLTVDDTEAMSEEQQAEALDEYQSIYGRDFGLAYFEQEYHCSFSGAMVGAYWGAEINRAERQGRVRPLSIDSRFPVHTAWDLGKAVNNPIWCFQVIDGRPHIVDFYQPDSLDLAEWVAWLNGKGYTGTDYVPHDILVTEWGSGRSRIDMLRALGRKPERIPMVAVADGIQAGVATINLALFADNERVAAGIDGLKNYRRDWDDERKTFRDAPVKDWAEHIGSAFRYLSLAWRNVPAQLKLPPKVPSHFEYMAQPDGSIKANMTPLQYREAQLKRKAKPWMK